MKNYLTIAKRRSSKFTNVKIGILSLYKMR